MTVVFGMDKRVKVSLTALLCKLLITWLVLSKIFNALVLQEIVQARNYRIHCLHANHIITYIVDNLDSR